MDIEQWVQEGGFAFAAILMAFLLVWYHQDSTKKEAARSQQDAKYMDERGRWVDSLLVRLERTEESHSAMTKALEAHTGSEMELLKAVTGSLQEIQIKLASLNGGNKR